MKFSILSGLAAIFLASSSDALFFLDLDCTHDKREPFKRFWTSTGFSPTPINNISTFLLSKDEEINLALIGAVPNGGVTHARIHWLLDLININCTDQQWEYDFKDLFQFISRLRVNGLSPGFELMGNPSGCFSNWTESSSHWPKFLNHLLKKLIDEFGYEYVSRWRFESQNEPDLKSYNTWNFTTPEFILHLQTTFKALSEFNLTLWGPAGLFKNQSHHPLCWGLLDHCEKNPCPVQVLTFHKKGDGVASQVVQGGRDLVQKIRSTYPGLNFSYVNDEADPLTGWSKPEAWRGDVRYAAAVAQNVIGHWQSFNEIHADLEAISNDNGFLGFSPNYWTQRTLTARFQMNNTIPPHVQLFKKPILVLMEMLSLLGDQLIEISYSVGHPGLSYIITEQEKRKSILVTINNDSLVNTTWNAPKKYLWILLKLPNTGKSAMARTYLLDNYVTNPFRVWETAGKPDYPDEELRRKLRRQEIPRQQQFKIRADKTDRMLSFKLSIPAILLINICNEGSKPGRPKNLRYIPITSNEVLLVWDDFSVNSRCLKSYVIEFRNSRGSFHRIPREESLSTSYHIDGSILKDNLNISGQYRVAALDMWNKRGRPSNILTI